MGKSMPKQYLPLAGQPLIYHTLHALLAEPRIVRILVVLAPGDTAFAAAGLAALGPRIETLRCGGDVRAASVYNGLAAVRESVAADDWILVHDAARPCLSAAALARLIAEVGDDEAGGLLAIPVADTLKRSDGKDRVAATEPRARLWQAQTPQMFRYRVLVDALERAGLANVTDESAAVEHAGLTPRLVMGEARNLKVTYPEDLELAERILGAQRSARQ
jgi:2-C-methyl-D-erythritol 4-phosphate cytidylyltransferase